MAQMENELHLLSREGRGKLQRPKSGVRDTLKTQIIEMLLSYDCFHTALLRNLQLRCWRFVSNTHAHIPWQGNPSPLIKEQW